jgi:hypothetical protein
MDKPIVEGFADLSKYEARPAQLTSNENTKVSDESLGELIAWVDKLSAASEHEIPRSLYRQIYHALSELQNVRANASVLDAASGERIRPQNPAMLDGGTPSSREQLNICDHPDSKCYAASAWRCDCGALLPMDDAANTHETGECHIRPHDFCSAGTCKVCVDAARYRFIREVTPGLVKWNIPAALDTAVDEAMREQNTKPQQTIQDIGWWQCPCCQSYYTPERLVCPVSGDSRPTPKASEQCQHDLLKPDTTVSVIAWNHAKCRVCKNEWHSAPDKSGGAQQLAKDAVRDIACCDTFVRESASEFCATCGYTNLDHLRKRSSQGKSEPLSLVYHQPGCEALSGEIGAVCKPCTCGAE